MSKKFKKEKEYTLTNSALWGIFWFFALLLIDQLTKAAADAYFHQSGVENPIVILPDMISLTITYNRGIAFSGLADAGPAVKIGIVAATALIMFLLTVFYFKTDKRRSFLRAAIVLVVAGGIGNLIDRIYYRVWDASSLGGVRDLVNVKLIFDFGCCNFADFFIVAGAVMLLLSMFFFDRDALFPVGKYKKLAKEQEEADENKPAQI